MELLILLFFTGLGAALSLFFQNRSRRNSVSIVSDSRPRGGLLSSNRRYDSDARVFCEFRFKHPHGKLCNFCNKNQACLSITALLPVEGGTVFCCDDCRDLAKHASANIVALPIVPDQNLEQLLVEVESLTGDESILPDHESKNPH